MFKTPFIPIENYEFEKDTLHIISHEFAQEYNMIPIDKMGNLITIAMSDIYNEHPIKLIEQNTGLKVMKIKGNIDTIKEVIKREYI